MKKTIILVILLLSINIVKAESMIEQEIKNNGFYTNELGVKIDLANYNKMKFHLSDETISKMSQLYYDVIKNSTGINNSQTKYFETYTFINSKNEEFTTTKEITEEEYKNGNNINNRASTHSTSMKQLSISEVGTSITTIAMETSWKSTPQNLSYDVTAIRTTNNININNATGQQPHVKNGTWQYIDYDFSSPNFKTFSKGIGLSHNLVDNATQHKVIMTVTFPCQQYMKVYGTYQHAQGNVTLAQSQDYTLIGGTVAEGVFGNVIQFNNLTTRSIYDKTAGVDLTLTCS